MGRGGQERTTDSTDSTDGRGEKKRTQITQINTDIVSWGGNGGMGRGGQERTTDSTDGRGEANIIYNPNIFLAVTTKVRKIAENYVAET